MDKENKIIDVECTVNGCKNKAIKTASVFGIEGSPNIITRDKPPTINKNEIFIQNFCKKHFKRLKKCDNFIEEVSEVEEKKDTDKKFIINEYVILIIFIVLSIILGAIIFGLYLKDSRTIVVFGLGFGLALGVLFLYSLIYSLKSEDKWCIIVSFNDAHEGIFEIICSIMVIIIAIIAIIECFVNIF